MSDNFATIFENAISNFVEYQKYRITNYSKGKENEKEILENFLSEFSKALLRETHSNNAFYIPITKKSGSTILIPNTAIIEENENPIHKYFSLWNKGNDLTLRSLESKYNKWVKKSGKLDAKKELLIHPLPIAVGIYRIKEWIEDEILKVNVKLQMEKEAKMDREKEKLFSNNVELLTRNLKDLHDNSENPKVEYATKFRKLDLIFNSLDPKEVVLKVIDPTETDLGYMPIEDSLKLDLNDIDWIRDVIFSDTAAWYNENKSPSGFTCVQAKAYYNFYQWLKPKYKSVEPNPNNQKEKKNRIKCSVVGLVNAYLISKRRLYDDEILRIINLNIFEFKSKATIEKERNKWKRNARLKRDDDGGITTRATHYDRDRYKNAIIASEVLSFSGKEKRSIISEIKEFEKLHSYNILE